MANEQNTDKGNRQNVVTGATDSAASEEKKDPSILWAISNRQDDRVVLFERDPRHPGGEAFVGGPTPDRVYRTAEVERLLHTGEIVEIPEPPDGPKKPVEVAPVISDAPPAMPGQAIRLGRKLDPDLVPHGAAMKQVRERQGSAPREIKSKATVPPPPASQKESQSS